MIPVLRAGPAQFDCIRPAGFRILAALDNASRLLTLNLELRCGTEGHAPDDPHTLGEAYDVRTRTLSTVQILELVRVLQRSLPSLYFTVLLETPTPFLEPSLVAIQYLNPHATGPHLHIQRNAHSVYPPDDEASVHTGRSA